VPRRPLAVVGGRRPVVDRPSRRRWLALFVSLNLLVWIAAAIAVGVIASDRVDLGGEALVRAWHATAEIGWQRLAARLPGAKVTPAAIAGTTYSPPGAVKGVIAIPPAMPQASSDPTVISAAMPQAELSTPSTLIAKLQLTRTPQPLSPNAAPLPVQTAVAAPLLLSDLGLANSMRLDREMERSTPGRAVQIRYQEAALNQEIQFLLRNNPGLPYGDVVVDLRRDHIVATGAVELLGFRARVEMDARIGAVDCRPELEIRSISIAGLLTPGFVKDQILAKLLEVTTWYPADYPLCLEQIVIEEDSATVYGHRR